MVDRGTVIEVIGIALFLAGVSLAHSIAAYGPISNPLAIASLGFWVSLGSVIVGIVVMFLPIYITKEGAISKESRERTTERITA